MVGDLSKRVGSQMSAIVESQNNMLGDVTSKYNMIETKLS